MNHLITTKPLLNVDNSIYKYIPNFQKAGINIIYQENFLSGLSVNFI